MRYWFLFLLIFVNKKWTLKFHGLIFGEGGGLFARYFRVLLIYQGPRRKGQKINMEKPKNYIYVFLVGANVVGAVWKFWILAFLEALKTKFKRFLKKHCCFIKRWREWPLCDQPLYTDPVYLFTVFLFYLYSCSNIIVKLITKTKAMAVIQN